MAHETLTSLREAVALSRSIRELADRGEIGELVERMHDRDRLLTNIFALLESLKTRGKAAAGAAAEWTEVVSVIREFEMENALLIEGLNAQRTMIARNITEAEGHRRLSAYVA